MIARLFTLTSRIPLYALLLLLTAGLVVGLAGCGGGGEQSPQDEQPTTSDQDQDQGQQDEQTQDEDQETPSDDEGQDQDADEQETSDGADDETTLVDRGQQVAQQVSPSCIGCHSTDGSQRVGPTWQGAYGHEVTLQNGDTIMVDEAYIRESIRNPGAKIVQGFSPAMPSYSESQISEDDIKALIAYIKSLSDASEDGEDSE